MIPFLEEYQEQNKYLEIFAEWIRRQEKGTELNKKKKKGFWRNQSNHLVLKVL